MASRLVLALTAVVLAASCGGDEGRLKSVGEACSAASECEGGVCAADLPGGYCTTPDCAACPDGSVCAFQRGAHACYQACLSSSDCRDGYRCQGGACVGPCTASEDCGVGFACRYPDVSAEAKECVAKPPAGGACTEDADCATGACLVPENVCAHVCESSLECPGDQICALRPVLRAGERFQMRGLCAPLASGAGLGQPCGSHASCATGFCHLGVCTHSCTSVCPQPGLTCTTSQEPLSDERSAPIRVCLPERATLVWDTATWPETYQRTIPVPGHTVAFSVVAMTDSATTWPVVMRLTGPGREIVFAASKGNAGPQRFFPQEEVSTMLVPNSPSVRFDRSGAYGYYPGIMNEEFGFLDGKPRTRIYYKLAPGGQVDTGILRLNVFISNLRDHPCNDPRYGALRADNAPEVLSKELDRLEALLGKAGITLGEVRFLDLARNDLQTIDVETEQLGQLFAASRSRTETAVNVFVVRRLTPVGVLGISGGIPGPPMNGTRHSGVAVSWDGRCFELEGASGESIIGNVIAHEIGHFLGLFHNVERDGSTDAIEDSDTSPNNLMYWNEQGGSDLSPGQGFVMRNNVLVE